MYAGKAFVGPPPGGNLFIINELCLTITFSCVPRPHPAATLAPYRRPLAVAAVLVVLWCEHERQGA